MHPLADHMQCIPVIVFSQEELWCGHAQQRSGQISVWNMTTQHCRVLAHAQEKENRTVSAIISDGDAVWSYVYPGPVNSIMTFTRDPSSIAVNNYRVCRK